MDWNQLAFKSTLIVHVVSGTAAVIVGVVPLVAPKPFFTEEGQIHRRSGRLFHQLMMAVIGTAIVMTLLRPNAYFAGLSASAAIGVFSGMRVLRRKRPDVDLRQRATLLDWCVTLIAAAVALYLIGLIAAGAVERKLPVVRALGFGTLSYAVWDLYRFMRPASFPFTPNLWLYEHLVKLIGGYFAAVAAFSGSVLLLFPEPWRQLWATGVGTVLAIATVIRYRRRIRGREEASG